VSTEYEALALISKSLQKILLTSMINNMGWLALAAASGLGFAGLSGAIVFAPLSISLIAGLLVLGTLFKMFSTILICPSLGKTKANKQPNWRDKTTLYLIEKFAFINKISSHYLNIKKVSLVDDIVLKTEIDKSLITDNNKYTYETDSSDLKQKINEDDMYDVVAPSNKTLTPNGTDNEKQN